MRYTLNVQYVDRDAHISGDYEIKTQTVALNYSLNGTVVTQIEKTSDALLCRQVLRQGSIL